MASRVIVGTQWGDEGKAKIVDFLTAASDYVIRFQGGANAGHTVMVEGEQFIFHLIPAGIMHKDKICIIGNGVVFEPAQFAQELKELKERGIDYKGRIFLSNRASLVMPYHKFLDQLKEKKAIGGKIGTTGRGIGPAYVDKVGRVGIRVGDLFNHQDLKEKIANNLAEKNQVIEKIYGEKPFDCDALTEEFIQYGKVLKEYVIDTSLFLNRVIREGKNLLFEGAQGTNLDIDHGTYPFVTSSNTIAAAACTGCGIGPNRIDEIIGITKAYTTRVGNGPFPTELDEKMGDRVRKIGGEFGATTGRPRRCGWFDAVVVKRSADLNGLTKLAITKLDVLDSLEKIKICTAYRLNGKSLEEFPGNAAELEKVEPVYEEMDGWQHQTRDIRNFNDLPELAKKYLDRLSALVDIPIALISVGPSREQTITTEML
jgi:adenylosuccinate synthase